MSRPALPLNEQPLDLQYALSQELGLDDATYHLHDEGSGVSAANPAQGLRTTFDNLGMQISANGYGWGIELAGFGRSTALNTVAHGVQQYPNGNRVEFDHGPLSSWYVNGPLGVQQGWTVRARPTGAAEQQLTLALLQSGNLRGRLDADGRGLQLVDETGTTRLSYGGPIAVDASSKDLPVVMDLVDGCGVAPTRCASDAARALVAVPQAVRIRVDDRGATYPLTIDPWVKTGTLLKPAGASNDFGTAIAVSGDGSMIAVSAPADLPFVYVFTRNAYGEIDNNDVARLYFDPNNYTSPERRYFGSALAMSEDGSTIIFGTRRQEASGSTAQTAAFLFVRSGAAWTDRTDSSARLAPLGFNGRRSH